MLTRCVDWHGSVSYTHLKYGDMDQWIIRKVHESGVIGGNTKLLYEIGPTKEIDGNKPYKNMGEMCIRDRALRDRIEAERE